MLLKVIFFILMGLILYYQLFYNKKINLNILYIYTVDAFSYANYYYLLISVLLLPLNWYIEIYKWLFILKRYEDISYYKAAQAVFLGLTLSLFTPNRVGEYGGRLLLVQKEHINVAVFSTLVGNLAQWVVLLLFGFCGYIYLIFNNYYKAPITIYWQNSILIIGFISLLTLLYIYINLSYMLIKLKKYKFIGTHISNLIIKIDLKKEKFDYGYIFLFSMLRYWVYTFQYVGLLYFFGLNGSLLSHFSAVSMVFFIQTGLPVPPATGILVRANAALFVFSYFQPDNNAVVQTVILCTSLLLWIINLFLPALLGYLVLFRVSFLNKKR